MRDKIFIFLILLFYFAGCGEERSRNNQDTNQSLPKPTADFTGKVRYATKFNVENKNGYTVITVFNPWQGASQNYIYVLFSKGQQLPDLENFKENSNDIIQGVQTPLESIILTSTTFIPLLDQLNVSTSLIGFPDTDLISSEKVRRLVDEERVVNLGTESALNIEKLIELNPEALMDYAMQGENDNVALARKAGIAVIFNADYLEKTPLGRAEWIKFAGLFYNKTKEADSIFNVIESNYDSLKMLAATAKFRPSVYSGIVYGDTWFMPGGENSGAKFIKDAHGDYLWQHTTNEGSIKLSFETVYDRAHQADFWIGVASFNSLQEIKTADNRYSNFKAFKKGNVYSYNAKIGEKGGTTFFELGYARPDFVLADLIKIMHPELLPDYELYFYKKLE